MVKNTQQSPKRWLGVILLIAFGALIAWVFTAIDNRLEAIAIGVVIGLIVVGASKALDVELGWPKKS